jgi:5-methylcytosine-specific restriction endonuclease McrA
MMASPIGYPSQMSSHYYRRLNVLPTLSLPVCARAIWQPSCVMAASAVVNSHQSAYVVVALITRRCRFDALFCILDLNSYAFRMKAQILALRAQGLTYSQIKAQLGCSKGTIAYHCGIGQKAKSRARAEKRKYKKALLMRCNRFQRERLSGGRRGKLGKLTTTFNWHDVVAKFGYEPICYLTGRKLSLLDSRSYHFDHIVPLSKGGASTLDNLGLCCPEANQAKSSLYVPKLLALCKEILEYSGYEVHQPKRV